METYTTIRDMLRDGKIVVPDYQRAYSWVTARNGDEPGQVNTFVSDLEDVFDSSGEYYFGHFLFEKAGDSKVYAIVDGQQRLTTISMFLAAAYRHLELVGYVFTEDDFQSKEDLLKRGSRYRFETVEYDRIFFEEYAIEGVRVNRTNLPYVSETRIADAVDFFNKYFASKDVPTTKRLIEIVQSARCTTHTVGSVTEAVQMFLFQNNRGKKPTRLEIVKAILMRSAYLKGGEARDELIRDLTGRFESVYTCIAAVDGILDEDEVLSCAMRVYANSLWAEGSVSEIEGKVNKDGVEFVKEFSRTLSDCFSTFKTFFTHDADAFEEAHGLKILGCVSWVLPFIVKADRIGLDAESRRKIWHVVESLLFRQRVIGTRAQLESRLNQVYSSLKADNAVQLMEERFQRLRSSTEYWDGHWSDANFELCLNAEMTDRPLARYILWKYENLLRSNGSQAGYNWMKYEDIEQPELEHIAPQTETCGNAPAHGYGVYEDEQIPTEGIVSGHWMDCLGNCLLISKSHNCQISNVDFVSKYDTYTHLEQQKEIQMVAKACSTDSALVWDKNCIERRLKMIVEALMGRRAWCNVG